MTIEAGQVYGTKGSRDQSDFIRISHVENGEVNFHRLHGGFRIKADEASFLKDYEQISPELMQEILQTWTRVLVDTDSMGRAIPAWSNGTLWNGWQVPYFERSEIEKAVSDGTISNDYSKIVMLNDAVLVLLSIDGKIPEGHDWSAIVDELRGGGEVYERQVGDCTLEASLCPAAEIEAEGRRIQTFAIGDGWCWEVAEAPEPSAAP